MRKSCLLFVFGMVVAFAACGGGGGGGGGGATDVLFFAGNDGAGGASFNNNMELWSYDGETPAKVAELNPGVDPSYPLYFTALGDIVLFRARYQANTNSELLATDGSSAWLVTDIDPGTNGSHPSMLKVFKDKVYMVTSLGSSQLWQTDGTAEGTTVVAGPAQGITSVLDFAVLPDDKIYFIGRSATAGTGLFYTDGTSAVVQSVSTGFARVGFNLAEGEIVVRGTDVFFPADDGVRGMELWMSSGPGTGSTLVANIEPGAGSSDPGTLAVIGSTVVFSALRNDVGRELWSTMGTAESTTLVADINDGGDDSWPYQLTVSEGKLYFTADDGSSGYEPYITDLLSAPSRLADINSAGGFGSAPWGYQEYQGKVYFYADDGIHGWELWATDGTGPGTGMVFDLNPDGDGAFPD